MRSLPFFALLIGLSASCGEKPTDDVTDDDTNDTDTDTDDGPECTQDSDCDAWEICEEETCEDGDRNNAPEEAQSITLDATASGYINPAGDKDYFTYTSAGKEWVRIGTITEEVEGGLNTVVTVLRPNGEKLMSMDEFPTGSINSYDSLFHAYFAEAGDWTILVEDISTYTDDGSRGNRTFTYELEIKTWSSVTSEEDSSASPSLTFDVANGNTIYGAGVNLEQGGDEDFITVNLPYTDQPLEVNGIYNLPGTDADPKVSLYDTNLNLLAQKEGVGPEGGINYLFAEQATYNLVATDAAGTGGADHWFVLYIRTQPEDKTRNQKEMEPNDILEDATLVVQTTDTSSTPNFDKAYIRGQLLADGDEDWYRMDATADGTFNLYCGSESYGALGDLAVDIHSPDGTLLQTVTEGGDSTPDIEDVGPLVAGTYYLRFYSEDGMYGLGVFYRCGMFMYQAE